MIIGILLISSTTLAIGEMQNRETMENKVLEMEQVMEQSQLRERIQSNVQGLENAYIHANDKYAVDRIQENLEKFQNRYQYRYENYEVAEVDGKTMIKAEKKVKLFGFIPVMAKDEYEINEEGNVVQERRNFWARVLYKNREKIEQV